MDIFLELSAHKDKVPLVGTIIGNDWPIIVKILVKAINGITSVETIDGKGGALCLYI